MAIIILKIVVLLCFLIIPLRGPSRKKEIGRNPPHTTSAYSKYAVNEEGYLEEINENKEN